VRTFGHESEARLDRSSGGGTPALPREPEVSQERGGSPERSSRGGPSGGRAVPDRRSCERSSWTFGRLRSWTFGRLRSRTTNLRELLSPVRELRSPQQRSLLVSEASRAKLYSPTEGPFKADLLPREGVPERPPVLHDRRYSALALQKVDLSTLSSWFSKEMVSEAPRGLRLLPPLTVEYPRSSSNAYSS
jgi:hypothetical protein